MEEEVAGRCPICGSTERTFGHGFAGGGLGPYEICLGCDAMIFKERRDECDCLNGIAERAGEVAG